MLITARTALALRCPQCGKLETHAVSRFAFSGGATAKLDCSCGSHKLTAGARHGQVWLQIPCYLCDGVHYLNYNARNFWDTRLKPVACADTDLQLGVFGPEDEVESYVRTGGAELDRLLEDEAFGEYFDHPEVMYQALSRVHTMAEEGNLTCSCGNRQISVDIYPERLDLSCPTCGRHKSVPAGTEEDLALLDQVRHIVVGDDAPSRRKGHKK